MSTKHLLVLRIVVADQYGLAWGGERAVCCVEPNRLVGS